MAGIPAGMAGIHGRGQGNGRRFSLPPASDRQVKGEAADRISTGQERSEERVGSMAGIWPEFGVYRCLRTTMVGWLSEGKVERVKGVEPSWPAWKAGGLRGKIVQTWPEYGRKEDLTAPLLPVSSHWCLWLANHPPEHGGHDLDLELLGEMLNRYPFLKDCITKLPESDDARNKYERMDEETIRRVCEELLSVL